MNQNLNKDDYFEAYGLVYRLKFVNNGLQVQVDINVRSPLNP